MKKKTVPKPPKTYQTFVKRYPKLREAWECIAKAGNEGPLNPQTRRLVKLAVAMGASSEGAVHSNVRKALAMGISKKEIEQVVALSASTMGLPFTVALFSWVQDYLHPKKTRKE